MKFLGLGKLSGVVKAAMSKMANTDLDFGRLSVSEEVPSVLEQLLIDGETLVTNVKVAVEYRERTRQDAIKKSKKDRLQKLKSEAQECEETYKTIAKKWFIEAKGVLPLELYEKIQEQQNNCDNLLEKKQDLIDDLEAEMEENDVEYEDDLEKYQNDMMLMGDRIDDHVDTLRAAFMEELQLLEDFTTKEQEVLLEQNQQEWMNLLEKFEATDKNAISDRQKSTFDRLGQLANLFASTKEDANAIKRALQDDYRALQLELEHIKVATISNTEKLEYNLEVLRRREVENLAMKNSMKRYLLKIQDKFNDKVQEYRNMILNARRDNERIIKEIQRLETIIGEGRSTTTRLVSTEYHRYMDLWKFNEEEAMEKLSKIYASEKWIFETQFGLRIPDFDVTAFADRPSEVFNFLQGQKEKHQDFCKEVGHGEEDEHLFEKKVHRLKFPHQDDAVEYWDRFLTLLNPRNVDWSTVLYCFTQYNKLLKVRNQSVKDVNSLFRENVELSYLLQKYMGGAGRQCFQQQHNYPPPYC